MLASLPFGVIFGVAASGQGLPPFAVLAMSLFVFSGSAQFFAILLLGSGAGLGIVWFATLALNLRHLLYAAHLVGHVRRLSQSWRFILAVLLTDETFAVMERRYRERGDGPAAHYYYLGSCLGMYANWAFWTAIGIYLNDRAPAIQDWGLEFAMVVTFIGIIIPACRSRAHVLAALVAGLAAVAGRHLPYNSGLMLAAFVGIAAGLIASRWFSRIGASEDSAKIAHEEGLGS